MKRVKLVLMVLTLLFIVCISSCNKVSKFNNQNYGKIKYYVAGLYIQVNEYDEFDLDDPNPKIYFDFSSTKHFGMLNTKSGALDAAMNISNLSKTIKEEDGINKYYMTAKLNFVNSFLFYCHKYVTFLCYAMPIVENRGFIYANYKKKKEKKLILDISCVPSCLVSL